MSKLLLVALVSIFLGIAFNNWSVRAQDEPAAAEDEDDGGIDAFNLTIEEKVGFINRWCTGDQFAKGFMKAMITCRDKCLTPEEVKKEDECFGKAFEGKSVSVIHSEEEEKKFVCEMEKKEVLVQKKDEIDACFGASPERKIKYNKDMKACMKDQTEEIKAMKQAAIDFMERWCEKEEYIMKFMAGYIACRDECTTKETMAKEEACFQEEFGKDVSLKALHDESVEREMVCKFKDKSVLLKKHHKIWACVKPTPAEIKVYKHDFKACMDKKGFQMGPPDKAEKPAK